MLSTIFLPFVIFTSLSNTIVIRPVTAFVVPQQRHLFHPVDRNENKDDIKSQHHRLLDISSIQRAVQVQPNPTKRSHISTRRWSLLDDATNALDGMDDTTKQAAIAVAGGGGLVTFVGSVIASQFNKDSKSEDSYSSNMQPQQPQQQSPSSYAVSKWTPYTSVKSVPGSSSSNYLSKMSQPSSVRNSNGLTSFVARMKDLMKGIQSSKEQQQQVVASRDRTNYDYSQPTKPDVPFFQNKPAVNENSNNVNSPLNRNTQLRERLEEEKNRVTGTEDRVKQMWMNRERLQVVKDPFPPPAPPPPVQSPSSASSTMDYMKGIGSTSSYTKASYSMTKWSPSQGVPSSVMSRTDDNYYGSNSFQTSSSSSDTVGNAGRGSTSYGSATAPTRKSYAMTRWNPYTKVNAAMGSTGSYLANMASGFSIPSPNPASPVSPMNNVASPAFTPVAVTFVDQKSEPFDYISNPSSTDSRNSVVTTYTDKNKPQEMPYSSTTTSKGSGGSPNVGFTAQSYNNIGSDVKKSYSVSKWTPNSQVSTTSTAMSIGTTYLSNIQTGATSPQTTYSSMQPSYAVPPTTLYDMRGSTTSSTSLPSPPLPPAPMPSVTPPLYDAPAPTPYTARSSSSQMAVSNMDYLSMLSGVQTVKSKKSYAMTNWSPGNRVNNAVSNPYLTNMNYSSSTPPFPAPAPSYPVMTSPAIPPPPASASLQQPNFAYGSRSADTVASPPASGNAYEQMYRQYSMTTAEVVSPNAVASTPISKSYSMTNWSPKSEVKDVTTGSSSASYLSKVSTVSTPQSTSHFFGSFGGAVSAAPSPASGSTIPFGNIAMSDDMKPAKSYSMTSWSPKSAINAAMAAGSSTTSSYLSNMSVGSSISNGAIHTSAKPSTSFTSAWGGSTHGGANIDEANKKSYSMTSWSPKSAISISAGASGSSDSYLSAISNGISPSIVGSSQSNGSITTNAWSDSIPASPPSPAWSGSAPSGNKITEVKKSYSMTSWSPKSETKPVPTGSSASYLSNMSTGSISTFSYDCDSVHTGSDSAPPQTSYKSSESFTSSSSYSSSTNPRSTAVPTLGPGLVESFKKKSYSMTNWSPKSQPIAPTTGSSASYLSTISCGSLTSPPTHKYSPRDTTTFSSKQASQYDTSLSPASNGDILTSNNAEKFEVEKSYSTTKWTPRSQPNAMTTDSYTSYMSSVSRETTSEDSLPESESYTYVSSSPYSSTGPRNVDYPSEGIINKKEPKRAYSMTSWSPKAHKNTEILGSSASYLSNMSSGSKQSTMPVFLPGDASNSNSAVMPSSSPNWSNIPIGSSSIPAVVKKSYSMTNWSPKNQRNQASEDVTKSLSSTTPATVSSPGNKVENDTSATRNTSESIPKKSYAMTSWTPKSQINVPTMGSNGSFLSNLSNDLSPAPSIQPLSNRDTSTFSSTQSTQPDTTTASIWSSDIPGSGSIGKTEPIKAYSTNIWSPNPKRSETNVSPSSQSTSSYVAFGSGSSYLSTISNMSSPSQVSNFDLKTGQSSFTSPPTPTPAPVWGGTPSVDHYANSLPKKSYSMTSWTPDVPVSTGWVDSMGQNGAYWGSMEAGRKASDGSISYDNPGFITALNERSTREYNGMMGSTLIPNGDKQHVKEKEEPPMSPQYSRLILQSDPVAPPFTDSIHAVVGASKTSYGPTKWSPEKGVPRRIL